MTSPLAQGSTIGILGGGQLGRMLSMAAARLGLKTHIYEQSAQCPAADVAHRVTSAAYDDEAALRHAAAEALMHADLQVIACQDAATALAQV